MACVSPCCPPFPLVDVNLFGTPEEEGAGGCKIPLAWLGKVTEGSGFLSPPSKIGHCTGFGLVREGFGCSCRCWVVQWHLKIFAV